jgi:hypothetical protein
VLLLGVGDPLMRVLLRSTTEMLSGLQTPGKSNLKTYLPSKFVDFCCMSPLMDGLDLIWDFNTSSLRDFDTSMLWDFDTLVLRDFNTSTLLDFDTSTLRDFNTSTLWDFDTSTLWDFYSSSLQDFGTLVLRDFRTSAVQDLDLRELCTLLTSNLPKPISTNPRISCHLSPFKIYGSC